MIITIYTATLSSTTEPQFNIYWGFSKSWAYWANK